MNPTKIIEPTPAGIGLWLRKLWAARGMVWVLAGRDLRIQYAQTVLGVLWTAGQPLVGLLVFTLFFGELVKVEVPGGVPYPLYAFAGMIGWFFLTYLVMRGGLSLATNQELISKVEFPRLVLPLSKVVTGLFEAGVSLVLLVGMMVVLGHPFSWRVVWMPVFLLGDVLIGLALVIWLSALTVRFRDLQHIVPYVVNLAIWLTPVFYPSTLIPKEYSYFLYLNPAAAVVEGLRWSLLGTPAPSIEYAWGFIPVLLLLGTGLAYFRHVEGRIADQV